MSERTYRAHVMATYMEDNEYSDVPAAKKMRTDDKDGSVDPHRAPPSPVLHVRGLRETATQDELVDAVQSFGRVAYVMMLSRKRQALIEFEDVKAATDVVKYSQTNSIYVSGQPAFFNFSTSTTIKRPPGEPSANSFVIENKVLLITVQNPKYPITTDVLHTICSPSGSVVRIVIFKKNGVQAMVEFDGIEAARQAKNSLNGCDIYSGCCTLKIDFAKPERLNVFKNDSESWDYTNSNPGGSTTSQNRTLLGDRPQPQHGSNGSESMYSGGRLDDYGGYSDSYSGGGDRDRRPYGPPGGSRQGPYASGQAMGGRGSGPSGPDGSHNGSGRSFSEYGDSEGFYGGGGGGSRSSYGSDRLGPGGRGDSYRGSDRGGSSGGLRGHGNLLGNAPASAVSESTTSSVMMVYEMNMDKFNCDRLFNLLCLYGNVMRIKFLKSKQGSAMVQLADGISVERVISNLNGSMVFGSKLSMGFSKQAYLQDVANPHTLPDGTVSYKDYSGSRNNRFSTPEAAAKNRITPPTKILHYYNTPAKMTEDDLAKLFEDAGARRPARIKPFPSKSDRSSTGLIEWDLASSALEALILTNHMDIPSPSGKNPYVFKLCFSSSPIVERGGL